MSNSQEGLIVIKDSKHKNGEGGPRQVGLAVLTNPKVSIIIPVYNGSNYLKEAIDSALAQTYKNIEIIVVNDGSTDNGATEKIAKSYGSKITYYKKENGGVATALNLGIQKMTGDYFSWLSHDDKYRPDRTERMVRRLSAETNAKDLIVASSFIYFNETTEFSPVGAPGHTPSHPLSYLFLGYINGCSIIVPKSVIEATGLFNEKLPTTQDFDYWFRILRNNKLVYLDDELTLSRSHEKQGSKALLNTHIDECNELWIRIVNELSTDEKIKIFGSELDFYNTIYEFLKANTLYDEAMNYIQANAFRLIKESKFSAVNMPRFIDEWSINLQKDRKTIFFPIFGHYTDRGGLNKMVSMVANRLTEKHNVIVASYTTKDGGYELSEKISYIRISESYSGVDSFKNIASLFTVDVTVVSHNCSLTGLELIQQLKLSDATVVAWSHEDYFLPYTSPKFSLVWPIRNDILQSADLVVWATNASNAAYSLRADNGMVIPNFMTDKGLVRVKAPAGVMYNIIAIARFDDPRKRIDLLLKTYEKIIAVRKEISLTILGAVEASMPYFDGETIGDAITRINANGGAIKLTGFVTDIAHYYAQSDVHILPSYGEGFGLTILESAYYGVPTAVFDNSGFRDIIDDGRDGIVAPEADTDELARRILALYANMTAMADMKKRAKNILSKFDEDMIMKEWERALNLVMQHKPLGLAKRKLNNQDMVQMFDSFERALVKFSENSQDNELVFANRELRDELSAIYNSKRWKYGALLAQIKNRIRK